MIRTIKFALFFLFVFFCFIIIVFKTDLLNKYISNTTIEMLKSEDVLYFTTTKVNLKITSYVEEKSLLLGHERVAISAPVTISYGFNLEKLSDSDIEIYSENTTKAIIITMPPLEILSVEVDLSQVSTLTQQATPLMFLKNRFANKILREEAERRLYQDANEQANALGLAPNRKAVLEKIENRLNNLLFLSLFVDTGFLSITLQ